MSGLLNSIKEATGYTPTTSDEEGNVEQLEEQDTCGGICPELTYQQRIIGFGTCFLLGYLITFASFHRLIEMIEGNPVPFATMYTVGNILALLSSMFLCGPAKQLRLMMDEKRKLTAMVYVSCLLTTIIVLCIPMIHILKLLIVFILVIVQCCAGVWYNLSYIPFGRRTVIRMIKGASLEDNSS
mmetsp:Transcript_19076/g.28773  ORF Transcript_19076/g.28773 Transcript_19076/m.28773 type:complete len:184 (+) Transcript_19076:49-600(+)